MQHDTDEVRRMKCLDFALARSYIIACMPGIIGVSYFNNWRFDCMMLMQFKNIAQHDQHGQINCR